MNKVDHKPLEKIFYNSPNTQKYECLDFQENWRIGIVLEDDITEI